MTNKNIKIGIIGLGYVGLPLALACAKHFKTFAFDLDKTRVRTLKQNKDTNKDINFYKSKCVFESNKNILKDCNIFIITVPTPVDKNNLPDLRNLLSASKTVARFLKKNDIVIYESTVYPGTTENICIPLIEKLTSLKSNKDFFYGYSPERVNPGDKNKSIEKITKIVSGSNKKTLNKINYIYSKIISAGTFKVKKVIIAESAKIIENIQRDVNVALMNELAKLFEKINVDFPQILEAASTKWNFLKFKPGLVGGHCIGVDPYYLTYLAKKKKFNPKLILQARKINEGMSNYHAKKILHGLKKSKKYKILICGFAFKANCADFRNTGVFKLFTKLNKKNIILHIFDPLIDKNKVLREHKLKLVSQLKKNSYDIIIMAVDHDIFKRMTKEYFLKLINKNGYIYDLKKMFK